jgi:hypothetical protein
MGFFGILKSTEGKIIGPAFVIQLYRSADPDLDLYQNVTDSEPVFLNVYGAQE